MMLKNGIALEASVEVLAVDANWGRTDLQGEGLGEVHSNTAVVLPQHAEDAACHAPQTLVLLGLPLSSRREQVTH